MSTLHLLKTLEAFQLGRPVEKGGKLSTLLLPAQETCFVSFVRMGGESIPWGVAFKVKGKTPQFFTVPDPRKRTELAFMLRAFSEAFRKELKEPRKLKGELVHPQVWLPNQTHLDMFHFLALRYLWTKFEVEGDGEGKLHAAQLRALGRLSNFLFNLSQIPGQTMVVLGTAALKSAFFFPSDSLRQAHLGFLLGWLETPGSREARIQAAAAAEVASISTSMDPQVEKKELEDWVEIYNSAEEPAERKKQAVARIDEVIRRELTKRLEVVERAHGVLSSDQRESNPGLQVLCNKTTDRYIKGYHEVERAVAEGRTLFIAGAETDSSPLSATMAYMDREEAQVLAGSSLLAHDPYLQAEAVASGDAIQGKVLSVKRSKIGKAQSIEWRIEASDAFPLKLREGTALSINGIAKSVLVLDRIDVDPKRKVRIFSFSVEAPKTDRGGIDIADPKFVGQERLLLPIPYSGGKSKYKALFAENKPGAWILEELKAVSRTKRKAS